MSLDLFKPRIALVFLLLFMLGDTIVVGAQTDADPAAAAMDRAFNRLYNFDFTGLHSVLNARIQSDPNDPLAYALRGAEHLFAEYNRLKILELDFFSNDDKLTDKKRLKPDPAVRTELFAATSEARKRAAARLAQQPEDRMALFALSMAVGLETEYTIMIEKKYLRSYGLSKENQRYARKLLALTPPVYDAYVTIGAAEYVVANLNFVFRIFVRFDGIEGSRPKAIENLKRVIEHGRFYKPYAKILLAVVYLREKRADDALVLLKELEHDFPENPLYARESAIIAEKITTKGGRRK
jgi:hypothetical protein